MFDYHTGVLCILVGVGGFLLLSFAWILELGGGGNGMIGHIYGSKNNYLQRTLNYYEALRYFNNYRVTCFLKSLLSATPDELVYLGYMKQGTSLTRGKRAVRPHGNAHMRNSKNEFGGGEGESDGPTAGCLELKCLYIRILEDFRHQGLLGAMCT